MLLQVYVAPAMWWSLHVYWVSILLVLVLLGPGAISIDAMIRTIYRRDRRPGRCRQLPRLAHRAMPAAIRRSAERTP